MAVAKERAPQAFARAEQLRLSAEDALADERPALAEALAQQALVAFERAALRARLVQVQEQLAQANLAIAARTKEIASVSAQQQQTAQQTKQLELRIEIEQNTEPRGPIEPMGGPRAGARSVAARSIAESAQLLCVAARLLAPENAQVEDALAQVELFVSTLDTLASHDALSKAMDQRIACLKALSNVRQKPAAAKSEDAGDVLLASLSPALADLRPHRDDRGIILTAYDVWSKAGDLTQSGKDVVDRIAPVVASHPFPLLVVLHQPNAAASKLDAAAARGVLRAHRLEGEVRIVTESLPTALDPRSRETRTEFVLVTQ